MLIAHKVGIDVFYDYIGLFINFRCLEWEGFFLSTNVNTYKVSKDVTNWTLYFPRVANLKNGNHFDVFD